MERARGRRELGGLDAIAGRGRGQYGEVAKLSSVVAGQSKAPLHHAKPAGPGGTYQSGTNAASELFRRPPGTRARCTSKGVYSLKQPRQMREAYRSSRNGDLWRRGCHDAAAMGSLCAENNIMCREKVIAWILITMTVYSIPAVSRDTQEPVPRLLPSHLKIPRPSGLGCRRR